MPIPIPSPLVEFVLLGPLEDRRQLQESPILGDVWVEFGRDPAARKDLLIVPFKSAHPGVVAEIVNRDIDAKVQDEATPPNSLPTWEEILSDTGSKAGFSKDNPREVAYLQGLVVARLTFREVLNIVLPKTPWWINKWHKHEESKQPSTNAAEPLAAPQNTPLTTKATPTHEAQDYGITKLTEIIQRMLDDAIAWNDKKIPDRFDWIPSFERFLTLMGLILWAEDPLIAAKSRPEEQMEYILVNAKAEKIAGLLLPEIRKMVRDFEDEPLVWQISLNRTALPALSKSVPAVKADAAKTLFKVDCSEIAWAVIDSGIDGTHPAFMKDGKSRVKGSFDFKGFRRVMDTGNDRPVVRKQNLMVLLSQKGLVFTEPIRATEEKIRTADELVNQATKLLAQARSAEALAINSTADSALDAEEAITSAKANVELAVSQEIEATKQAQDLRQAAEEEKKRLIIEADAALSSIAQDARNQRPIHWELVEKFVAIVPGTETQTNHGTHVAGIIGASQEAAKKSNKPADVADGMCPDISLYDFRVLGRDTKETEFAIIGALQFIRQLNDRQNNQLTIHGANLSLSIPHDVRNFACGHTPICAECERLVANGVVVVAAAGNHGYKSFQTADGSYDSYAAFSITDPGNAENVLTVGATHRFWPHTYGVSFFSSRGPTGDGRLKPDLVAPGEKINSTFPGDAWGYLDGTSMAAPHVSGAAAMLMARYSELIRQPLRIKRILCESATDLGRERSFQGHGMLDVLRSFQSI